MHQMTHVVDDHEQLACEANATTLGTKTRVTEIDKVIDLDVLVLPREDERALGCASTSVVKMGEETPGQASMSVTKVVGQADQQSISLIGLPFPIDKGKG